MKNLKLAQTISYFVAFVALGLALAVLGPTLSGLAARTHTDIGEISYLFTVRSFGLLVGSLFSGWFYDRMRGHVLMAAMILMISASMALMPLITTFSVLLGVMFVFGTADGVLGVGGNALLVWVHQDRVAPYMNALHFFFGVGAVLAPLIIAALLLINTSVTTPYLALALLIVPVAILLLRLPSPQNPQVAKEQGGDTRIPYGLVILVSLLLCLDIGVEVSYGGWIFNYIVRMNLGDDRMGALLTSVFWIALTVGRLVCVPLAVWLRSQIILLADLLGCILGVGIALLWPTSLAAISVATICTGFALGSVYPMALTFAGRRMAISGQVMSFFIVGGSVGGMIIPMLIGQMFESVGPHVMMLTILVDLIAALLVYTAMVIGFSAERSVVRSP